MEENVLETGAVAPVELPQPDSALPAGSVLDITNNAPTGIPEALAAVSDSANPVRLDSNPYGIHALWAQGDLLIQGVAMILLLMSIAS